jgi:acyl carrier protein
MNELIYKLKLQIIWALHLEDIRSEDIDKNAPLFGEEGLGLESLDILELAWVMERNYGIVLKDFSQCNEIFKSVATMADYIQKNRIK